MNFASGPSRGPASSPNQLVAAMNAYIVEDNALIRQNLMETMTELLGIHTVGYSSTETEACTWLHQHPKAWELLVLDMFLLEGSGLGVLQKCSKRDLQQRVVVLSNYATSDMRKRCLESGADAVFDKSTELDQFFDYCGKAA